MLSFQRDNQADGLWHLQGLFPCLSAYSSQTEKKNVRKLTSPTRVLDVMCAHRLLGHTGERRTREIAHSLGWKLEGSYQKCLSCMEAKARRKPIPKVAETSQTIGERLCLDLTGRFSTPAYGGTRYALVVEDQFTKITWTYPLKKKNCMYEHLHQLLSTNKDLGHP